MVCPAGLSAQTKLVPIVNAQFLGGQSFFRSKNTAVTGNAAFQATPSVVFSEKSKLIPTLSSSYRGILTVEELAGGGFLIQEIWDSFLTVKWARQLGESAWSIKPKASGRLSFNNESKGENFGSGLFDYEKASGGFEVERKGEKLTSQIFEAAYYDVRFPNYKALTSKQFGSEIKSGTKVLDFNALDGAYSFEWAMSQKTLSSLMLLGSFRNYPDQFIVNKTGVFETTKRKDTYLAGTASLRGVVGENLFDWRVRTIGGLAVSHARLGSNQNSFDATRTVFIDGYYDYRETSVSPSLSFLLNENQRLGFSWTPARRKYPTRYAQDETGNHYNGVSGRIAEIINLRTQTYAASYVWQFKETPWGKLSLIAQGAVRNARSNMRYEVAYRYNYNSANYFTGLSWEFSR